MSASARAFAPPAPSLLAPRLQGRAGEHVQASEGWRRKHSPELCEGGVGIERLCKGLRSLVTEPVVLETAREGR